MIRMVALGIGLLSVTYVLLWTVGEAAEQTPREAVSRAASLPLGLASVLTTIAAPMTLADPLQTQADMVLPTPD
ncbi:hypothetical protein [Ponticoccus alexandrii]|uniref:Uncharacterized protein n=1 Tax=Ponticoccus alexandrii TaxID=1943633 RepID=A0ABX7F3Y8_9RHOB|nr:hypothetical protein [Ponticoccus alexandrii]ETA53741.1 hypothetical protein P279_01575 [Rhodobacteraceae bacterium PD-2]QRF65053.1 hypothetical protein GQA70_01200 [Ponticoccus alexandrii]